VAEIKGLRSSKKLAELQEKRTALFRLIQNWREVQLVYTPHIALLTLQPPPATNENGGDTTSVSHETFAENIPLFLPSSLPAHLRDLPELQEACKMERRLREPQADDALAGVCHQCRLIQALWQFKKLNVSGTGNKPNAHMLSLYKCFNNKTQQFAHTY